MNKLTINARLAKTRGEREAVEHFIQTHALKTHGCEAPPCSPTGFLFGAWQQDVVVGSMYVEFYDDNEPYALEAIYGREAIVALCGGDYRPDLNPQGGRWFSSLKQSDVSLKVLQESCKFALSQGAEWFISEGRPYAFKRLREIGIVLETYPNARPNIENIPLAGRAYYESDPPPCLFRMRCDSADNI